LRAQWDGDANIGLLVRQLNPGTFLGIKHRHLVRWTLTSRANALRKRIPAAGSVRTADRITSSSRETRIQCGVYSLPTPAFRQMSNPETARDALAKELLHRQSPTGGSGYRRGGMPFADATAWSLLALSAPAASPGRAAACAR